MNQREILLFNQRVDRWWNRQRVIPTALGVAFGIVAAVVAIGYLP